MKYTPREPVGNVNVTPTHPIREFLVLAGGLLAAVLGLYLLLGLAVDWMAPRISPSLERRMAGLIFQSRSWERGQPDAEQALQTVLDRMQQRCARLPYEFKIHVEPSPLINALALPGGHIVVFTGLLARMTSENELAFVLAHEMGHYAHRDHLRGFGRALVLTAISAALFGADSSVSRMLGRSLNITEMSFSRAQETRADEFALRTVRCAYGHVGGCTEFFGKMPSEMDPGRFGHYFSSHPENQRRIAHLDDYVRKNRWAKEDVAPLPEALQKQKAAADNP